MIYNTNYHQELEAREARVHSHNYRHECMQSYHQARSQIETGQALGKSTYALELILNHAERNNITYAGAEHKLIHSGQLQATLQDHHSRFV